MDIYRIRSLTYPEIERYRAAPDATFSKPANLLHTGLPAVVPNHRIGKVAKDDWDGESFLLFSRPPLLDDIQMFSPTMLDVQRVIRRVLVGLGLQDVFTAHDGTAQDVATYYSSLEVMRNTQVMFRADMLAGAGPFTGCQLDAAAVEVLTLPIDRVCKA